jgi:signal transduction histidine kinase
MEEGIPIQIGGRVVGVVVATGLPPDRDVRQQRYQASINRAMLVAALGGVAVALLLAALLARTLTRPLRELTTATRSLAQGTLDHQVPVRSRDELGELADSFNQMSADLARANELRRQMIADIAHDLRTPLTVIVGYLESLRDGVLPATPARFETMYNEALQLQRLIDDLRTLSLADAGELSLNVQSVAPAELIEQTVEAFDHQAESKGIALQVQVEADLPAVQVDVERMAQVLGNLVSNALRHTPEGGTITLSARRQGEALLLAVQDTGAGIDPKGLPHLFERFYRGDKTRQQQGGESGLGLAIAKSLVEAHGGTIAAASEGLGQGSAFTVTLIT